MCVLFQGENVGKKKHKLLCTFPLKTKKGFETYLFSILKNSLSSITLIWQKSLKKVDIQDAHWSLKKQSNKLSKS